MLSIWSSSSLSIHRRTSLSSINTIARSRLASTFAAGASTSTNRGPYPFPTHSRPTPHEIFHLKPGATQRDIKARYYELVRVHHPDSPRCRSLPPNVCRSRFQAITAAYDVLTGKVQRRPVGTSSHSSANQWHRPRADYAHRHRSHSFHSEWAQQADEAEENADDRWKDRAIMAVGIFTIAVAISPFLSLFTGMSQSEQRHTNAAKNLAQARREAREYGELRRAQIRKRVRANEIDREYEELEANRERGTDIDRG